MAYRPNLAYRGFYLACGRSLGPTQCRGQPEPWLMQPVLLPPDVQQSLSSAAAGQAFLSDPATAAHPTQVPLPASLPPLDQVPLPRHPRLSTLHPLLGTPKRVDGQEESPCKLAQDPWRQATLGQADGMRLQADREWHLGARKAGRGQGHGQDGKALTTWTQSSVMIHFPHVSMTGANLHPCAVTAS